MTARDRTILIVLGAVLVVAGFWFFGLKPKRAEIAAADAQITVQQGRLQSAHTTLAAGRRAKADYPRAYAEVVKLGAAVPADDDLPSLLYQLDTAANGADVEFRSLSRGNGGADADASASSSSSTGTGATAASSLPPGATVGTAGLATLPFKLDFTGSFFDLERFLAGVQGWIRPAGGSLSVRGRLLNIEGVSLTPAGDDLSKITASVAATAYLSPEAKSSGSASSSAGPTGTTTTTPSTTTPPAAAAAAAKTNAAITEGGAR
jgi:Tfp pilus assembly protein PilO